MLGDENGNAEILQHWRKRSSYFSGRDVRVAVGDETIEGTTDGLELNGALRVKLSNGEIKLIQAGDVTRLRSRESN
jgi:biotin-(acetyl-CoA carboxylase) ligase